MALSQEQISAALEGIHLVDTWGNQWDMTGYMLTASGAELMFTCRDTRLTLAELYALKGGSNGGLRLVVDGVQVPGA